MVNTSRRAVLEGSPAETAVWNAYEAVKAVAIEMQAASLDDVLILAAFARSEASSLGGFQLTENEAVGYSNRLTRILSEIMIGLCRFAGVPESVAAADYDVANSIEDGGIASLRAAAARLAGVA
ncbi:hypothetical protein HN018_26765 (plasmid) [Lichenicola cladoniae]|uniref:Uncharacterized protein n=1 Tax=Lichenicola cladoniae TaxID=1484109 RepID=A0A6M8HZP9_9PROT|nr:hypothetical protein [Lichenicola cladoniae]NPD66624.1 hypothetical protein [Acetobacteraceae bacterium]QKE93736.1 hypothetical protein HN018_26765 [Lichenicola cladoniae]